jgi:hypothetical protein
MRYNVNRRDAVLCHVRPTSVLFLRADDRLASYREVAPLARCLVDLFNTPGWQAPRFVEWANVKLRDADVLTAAEEWAARSALAPGP